MSAAPRPSAMSCSTWRSRELRRAIGSWDDSLSTTAARAALGDRGMQVALAAVHARNGLHNVAACGALRHVTGRAARNARTTWREF